MLLTVMDGKVFFQTPFMLQLYLLCSNRGAMLLVLLEGKEVCEGVFSGCLSSRRRDMVDVFKELTSSCISHVIDGVLEIQ